MLRLFIGIPVPEEIHVSLQQLHAGIPGASWVDPENYHITLSFIGEVDEATAEDIDEALSGLRAPAFTLELKGTGHFDKRDYPSHLWAGVAECEELHRLKEKIDRALDSGGLPFVHRKYVPHVTIAKLKNADDEKLAHFLADSGLYLSKKFQVDAFTLYRSYLGAEGPAYEEICHYPLVQGPPSHKPRISLE